MKTLARLLILIGITSHCSGATIYENDFDSTSSLDGFVIGEIGDGRVLLDGGQLRINPGFAYLNRGFAALNVSQVAPGYNSILSSNPGMITWAFNVSNLDGGSDKNNLFEFGISGSTDAADPTGFGYGLGAGGYVGDRMPLYRYASTFSPFGNVYETMVDTTNGLSPLPQVGAVKLTYEPGLGKWSLYFEQHTFSVDPLSVTNLVGTSINAGFASTPLPYVFFESENYGSAFVDNFSISIVPEPATWSLLALGSVALLGSRRLHRRSS